MDSYHHHNRYKITTQMFLLASGDKLKVLEAMGLAWFSHKDSIHQSKHLKYRSVPWLKIPRMKKTYKHYILPRTK
jgi:hypothetical protein